MVEYIVGAVVLLGVRATTPSDGISAGVLVFLAIFGPRRAGREVRRNVSVEAAVASLIVLAVVVAGGLYAVGAMSRVIGRSGGFGFDLWLILIPSIIVSAKVLRWVEAHRAFRTPNQES
jgi:hypothetical protein